MPKTLIIAGEQFEVPSGEDVGLVEGHVCTAAEARSLAQTRNENIGNNVRKMIQDAIAAGTLADARQKVLEYAHSYTFAMPGAGGGTRKAVDPVEREARSLATKSLKDMLAAQGRKWKDTDEEKREAAIQAVIEKNDLLSKAKKIVAARQKAGTEALEGVDI